MLNKNTLAPDKSIAVSSQIKILYPKTNSKKKTKAVATTM